MPERRPPPREREHEALPSASDYSDLGSPERQEEDDRGFRVSQGPTLVSRVSSVVTKARDVEEERSRDERRLR